MTVLNLDLAVGDKKVVKDDPMMLHTPDPLGSKHHPLAHIEFFDTVAEQLFAIGLDFAQPAIHALSKGGDRYFGIAEMKSVHEDHTEIFAWRSTHDQRFAAAIATGSGVYACSNLCFSGEVKVSTRHTTEIRTRLPNMIRDAAIQSRRSAGRQAHLFDEMKQHRIESDSHAHDIMMRLVREEIVMPSRLPTVMQQWDHPDHPEFEEDGNSLWKMFNAVTESFKPATPSGDSINLLIERSPKLIEFVEEEML